MVKTLRWTNTNRERMISYNGILDHAIRKIGTKYVLTSGLETRAYDTQSEAIQKANALEKEYA